MITEQYTLPLQPPYPFPGLEVERVATYIVKRSLGWPKALTGEPLEKALESIQTLAPKLRAYVFGEARTVTLYVKSGPAGLDVIADDPLLRDPPPQPPKA